MPSWFCTKTRFVCVKNSILSGSSGVLRWICDRNRKANSRESTLGQQSLLLLLAREEFYLLCTGAACGHTVFLGCWGDSLIVCLLLRSTDNELSLVANQHFVFCFSAINKPLCRLMWKKNYNSGQQCFKQKKKATFNVWILGYTDSEDCYFSLSKDCVKRSEDNKFSFSSLHNFYSIKMFFTNFLSAPIRTVYDLKKKKRNFMLTKKLTKCTEIFRQSFTGITGTRDQC